MLKLNKNIDELLIAGALSNLFYSVAYPIVHTITMKSVNSNIMSLASLINCILVAIITKAWLNKSKELYKTFGVLLGVEVISYGILTGLFLIRIADPFIYFMGDALMSAIITRNIICGGTRLKALRYEGEAREVFDNKTTYYCNITSIIGYGFSTLVTLPTNLGFVFMFVGIAIDNIFYYKVFKNTK